MMSNPSEGEWVQIRYAKRFAHLWPYHGCIGKVVIAGKGKPRNHGIAIAGRIIVVPAGNLFNFGRWIA